MKNKTRRRKNQNLRYKSWSAYIRSLLYANEMWSSSFLLLFRFQIICLYIFSTLNLSEKKKIVHGREAEVEKKDYLMKKNQNGETMCVCVCVAWERAFRIDNKKNWYANERIRKKEWKKKSRAIQVLLDALL